MLQLHPSDLLPTKVWHILEVWLYFVLLLQQLYVATTDKPEADAGDLVEPVNNGSEEPDDCIICQTASISRALLPCRHACVCDLCFQRLDKCPMCRSAIVSYFRLSGSTYEEDGMEEEEEEEEEKFWLYRLSDALNRVFGFQ